MLLDTNTQTQAVTACTKTHTETPTCPTERPCQSDTSGFRLKKKREKRLSLEGKGERYVPRDFLTHLLSGWQSWQWVWEAGQGVA